MKKTNNHLAFCGLDCSKCAAFIATEKNDNQLRIETAKDWTARYGKGNRNRPPIKPQDINCKGCLSEGPIYLYCRQCEIRKCGLKKKITNCKECKKYRCKPLIEAQSHFF